MPRRRQLHPGLGLAAAGAPIVVSSVLSALRGSVSSANAVLVLVVVVVAVAAAGSRLAGMIAALSSFVWFDFFLLQPRFQFSIANRDDVETAVLLTLVSISVVEIVLWGRRHQARASEREGYLDGVLRAASMVADGIAGQTAVVHFVSGQIVDVLGIDSCEYVTGLPGPRPRLGQDGAVTREGQVIDVDRTGLPTNDVIELPVARGGTVLGRFVLTAATRVVWPNLEQRLVAVTLADQVAAALDGATESDTTARPA